MPNTHCLPSGSLGTGELPVPGVNVRNTTIDDPGGLRRGVVVWLHGANGNRDRSWPLAFTTADVTTGLFTDYSFSIRTNMRNDGWISILPPMVGDFYRTFQMDGLLNDLAGAGDQGTRHVTTILHWWDHVVSFIRLQFGANFPIVIFGGSWGGFTTLHVAANKQSTLTAYIATIPGTILNNIDPTILGVTLTSTTNMDAGQHILDNVTIPGMVLAGSADAFVGWGTPGQGTCPSSGYTLPVSNSEMITVNAIAAGRPCTWVLSSGNDHDSTATDVTTIANYFTNTINPLAPRTL